MDKPVNFYIEHSRHGAQVLRASCLTLDEMCDYAIRMECWGLTYSRASEEFLNQTGPV